MRVIAAGGTVGNAEALPSWAVRPWSGLPALALLDGEFHLFLPIGLADDLRHEAG
jgi:hypothetical protein